MWIEASLCRRLIIACSDCGWSAGSYGIFLFYFIYTALQADVFAREMKGTLAFLVKSDAELYN